MCRKPAGAGLPRVFDGDVPRLRTSLGSVLLAEAVGPDPGVVGAGRPARHVRNVSTAMEGAERPGATVEGDRPEATRGIEDHVSVSCAAMTRREDYVSVQAVAEGVGV